MTRTLDISTVETWLWDAACQIRGPIDAPESKDYILALIFLKRISDVFDDALDAEERSFRDQVIVHELLHLRVPNHGRLFRSLLRAYLDPWLVTVPGDTPRPHAGRARPERPLG